eukprot:Opistho-2@55920
MTGLPVFFRGASLARWSARFTRSSWCIRCISSFSSRCRCRRSFSFIFSACSTLSGGINSIASKSSSSLFSMFVSICSVLILASLSPMQCMYTSSTLRFISSSSFSWSSTPNTPNEKNFARSSKLRAFSSSRTMAPSRYSICCLRLSVSFNILSCVAAIFCLSSSRASSVSWLFWIRDKFCSSSSAKMSNSCFGSVKYSSGSSSSSSESISVPLMTLASSSPFRSRTVLRDPVSDAERVVRTLPGAPFTVARLPWAPYGDLMALALLDSFSPSLSRPARSSLRRRFSVFFSSNQSCGVSLSRNSL